MKLTFFTLLLCFSGFSASYGQKHDFQILLGLNMNDCINCYNNGLNKIAQKAGNADVIIVMSQVYERDSAKIIRKYNLRGITKNIVWSDSLFTLLTHGGRSVIAFASKYHNQILRYDLEGLPDGVFNYLKRYTKPLDTLFKRYPSVAQTSGILNPFFVHQNRVYFINKITDRVQGYDLLSEKRILDFSIPDSILKNTFSYSGIPASQYKQQHEILQHAHMAPYEINSLIFNQDTIFVVFTNSYFTVGADSTLRRDNLNFIALVGGRIVDTKHFPIFFKNQLDQNKGYYVSNHSFYDYNSRVYSFLYFFPKSGQPFDYHVLGSFIPDNRGSYVLNQLSPMKNPPLYKESLSCAFPVFNQGYFALPLIDTLYSVSGEQPPIPLDFIPKKYQYKTATDRCVKGIVIKGFYLTDDYVWVSYFNYSEENNSGNHETVVRHNRHTGANEKSSKIIQFGYSMSARFDPIDPDYLLFTLPDISGELYRTKMF